MSCFSMLFQGYDLVLMGSLSWVCIEGIRFMVKKYK